MSERLKVLILWDTVTGYTSACWRALAACKDLDLFIVGLSNQTDSTITPFADNVMDGLNYRLLDARERHDASLISSISKAFHPKVVMVCGWRISPYRNLCMSKELGDAKLIMTMDTPILHNWRRRLALWKIGRYLKCIDRIFVPGERGWQQARYWNIPETKIKRGLYGIDFTGLAPLQQQRLTTAGGWPKSFLYCGRYHQHKAIDVLLDGYEGYRKTVSDPWPLECCGAGPLRDLIARAGGVKDLGFVQPADMPGVWLRNGAFVIASRIEPWGQVITEAMAAGLPVLCTEACGAAAELVRPYFNGLMIPADDSTAVARGMLWLHNNYRNLAKMGERGRVFAQAYSAEMWAQRVLAMINELVPEFSMNTMTMEWCKAG